MSIYTKTGDAGQTSLANGQRIGKNSAILEAYGTSDELNALVGWLRAGLSASSEPQINEQLLWIQQRLFNLGASLAAASGEWILTTDVQTLEKWIDKMQEEIPPLHAFLIPSSNEQVARCHICRTVTRRLERAVLVAEIGQTAERIFINRLSDYFYLLARLFEQNNAQNLIVWDKNAQPQF